MSLLSHTPFCIKSMRQQWTNRRERTCQCVICVFRWSTTVNQRPVRVALLFFPVILVASFLAWLCSLWLPYGSFHLTSSLFTCIKLTSLYPSLDHTFLKEPLYSCNSRLQALSSKSKLPSQWTCLKLLHWLMLWKHVIFSLSIHLFTKHSEQMTHRQPHLDKLQAPPLRIGPFN